MDLETLFRDAVKSIQEKGYQYAVAGGIAADLYRTQTRTTGDVDLLFYASEGEGRGVVTGLGLKAFIAREADLQGGPLFALKAKTSKPMIVVGRTDDKSGLGVDLLLPTLPWFSSAIVRAQGNLYDFGFGDVPVITREDVIISKLYSLSHNAQRLKDADDINSIYQEGTPLDLAYLGSQLKALSLGVNPVLQKLLPKELVTLAKKIDKHMQIDH